MLQRGGGGGGWGRELVVVVVVGGWTHKDKNHISLEGACVTVIYAVSILAPH